MVQPWVVALGAVAALLALVALYHFNRMVTLRNRCQESWSNVDTELKRRYDLVPNLVEVVKGYVAHERGLLQQVTEARARAVAEHERVADQASDERPLVRSLQRLLAVAEDYPDLKADEQFLNLQKELAITEDRIQAARRFYNANVRDYRDLTRSFPGFLFADLYGFGEVDFFEVEPVARGLPRVEV